MYYYKMQCTGLFQRLHITTSSTKSIADAVLLAVEAAEKEGWGPPRWFEFWRRKDKWPHTPKLYRETTHKECK